MCYHGNPEPLEQSRGKVLSHGLTASFHPQMTTLSADPGHQLEDKAREVERKPGPLGTALPMEFWDCQLGASLFECLQETPIQIQLAKTELTQIKD